MLKKWGASARLDRHFVLFAISAIVLLLIYFWHLGALPLSGAEHSAVASAGSLHQIYNQPLNTPHKIIQYLFERFLSGTPFELRTVSVAYGLLFVLCFYLILKMWFGTFSAWLGALFFAGTPLLILTSRSATTSIMYLWPLVVIATYMKLVRWRGKLNLRLCFLSFLAAVSLYQPGGLLFLIIGAVYVWPGYSRALRTIPRKFITLAVVIFLAFLVPLILGLIHQPSIAKSLVLLPQHWPNALDILKNWGWSLIAFFIHSRVHHQLQLGRLAILNAAQLILLVFGLYALWSRARSRVYAFIAVAVIAALAAGINNIYTLLLFGLPALSLVITAGLRYLHLEWTSVFPRNPLPRGLAIILLLTLVCIQLAWGAHYALMAWPHRLPVL